MKILSFSGGLGNQIFEYGFYLYAKNKYGRERIFGHYTKKQLAGHNGLEINRWFDVKLPPSTLFSRTVYIFCSFLNKVGINRFFDDNTRAYPKDKAIAISAFRFFNSYFPNCDWIRFRIDGQSLSPHNQRVLKEIKNSQSVFIHVRRGDFLSDRFKEQYAGICTLEYYRKAVEIIEHEISTPSYFVFSDDMQWVKDNIRIENAVYIDFNKGEDSPLDMYLMSQCKAGILANSTFSYWGACLGQTKNVVVYPKLWIRNQFGAPKIFFKEWIGI